MTCTNAWMRGGQLDTVARAGDGDRDTVRRRPAVDVAGKLGQPRMGPRLEGHLQEGGALLAALQRRLRGSPERGGERRDVTQTGTAAALPAYGRLMRRAPGVRELHGVHPAATAFQHCADEIQQPRKGRDGTALDRPLQAMAVAERAGGIGRRAPREQLELGSERRWLRVIHGRVPG